MDGAENTNFEVEKVTWMNNYSWTNKFEDASF